MILYHTFSRIADGYDETYCSEGLARNTIESEILPLCKLDEPVNRFEALTSHAYTYKVIDSQERKAIFGTASMFNDGRRSKKYQHALFLDEDYDEILANPMKVISNIKIETNLIKEIHLLEVLTIEQENILLNAILSAVNHQGRVFVWFPIEESLERYSNVACYNFIKIMQKLPVFIRELMGFRSFSATLQRSRYINLIAMQPSTEFLSSNLFENELAVQFNSDGSYKVHGMFKNDVEPNRFFTTAWDRIPQRINALYIKFEKECNLSFKNEPLRHLRNIIWIYKNMVSSSSEKWEYDDLLFSIEALVLYDNVDIVKMRQSELLSKLFSHLHQNLLDVISLLDVILSYGDLCFKVERFQPNLVFLLKRVCSFDRNVIGAFILALVKNANTQKYVYQIIFHTENWLLYETFLEYLRKNRLMSEESDRVLDELMRAFSEKTNLQISNLKSDPFVNIFSDICKDIYDLKSLVLLLEKWILYLGAYSYKGVCEELQKVFLSRTIELFNNKEIKIEHYDWIERAAYLIEDAHDLDSYEDLNFKTILYVIKQSRTIEYSNFQGFHADLTFNDYSKAINFIGLAFQQRSIWQFSYDELLVYLMTTYDYKLRSFSLVNLLKVLVEAYNSQSERECREQIQKTIYRLERISNKEKKIGEVFQRDIKLFVPKNKWLRKLVRKNMPKKSLKWRWITLSIVVVIFAVLYILLLFYIFNKLIGG